MGVIGKAIALFQQQDSAFRSDTLGTAPRIAVEAAGKFGWTRYVDSEADVIGMDGFGASGPADQLYAHFGITKEAVIARAKARDAGSRFERVERCDTVFVAHDEERLIGYDVSYDYQGQRYTIRADRDPGATLELRVDVQPQL